MDYWRRSIIKTAHYSFELKVHVSNGSTGNIVLLVGEESRPCLEIIIPTNAPPVNERLRGLNSIATMTHIEGIRNCLSEEVSDEFFKKHSFSCEMLHVTLRMIKRLFPHIKKIALTDASFIPCNMLIGDTLDLFTYNIALYGKTWYEMHFGARHTNNKYDAAIATYMKEKPENFDEWIRFVSNQNLFAGNWLQDHLAEVKQIFENSATYPEFYKTLSKMLEFSDKCKIFRKWLMIFMRDHVPDHRSWFIPMEDNRQIGGTRRRRRQTIRGRRVFSGANAYAKFIL